MNREPNRSARPGTGGERHAVSVTRMCLRSGSIQLPFALAGTLPQGELLVHDVERDEPIMLWSDPPRTLAGLGPLFEAHEIQVNDQLVLDLQGDDLRVGVRKRPRRSRPQVTPSTWASHRQSSAAAAPERRETSEGEADATAHDDPQGDPDASPHGRPSPVQDPVTDPAADDAGRPAVQEARYVPDPLEDAPHAPRVKVSPLPRNTPRVHEPSEPPARPRRARTDRERSGRHEGEGGMLGGVWRAAKGWFSRGGSDAGEERGATFDAEPDWLDAWGTDAGESPADGPLAPDVPDRAAPVSLPRADAAREGGPAAVGAGAEDEDEAAAPSLRTDRRGSPGGTARPDATRRDPPHAGEVATDAKAARDATGWGAAWSDEQALGGFEAPAGDEVLLDEEHAAAAAVRAPERHEDEDRPRTGATEREPEQEADAGPNEPDDAAADAVVARAAAWRDEGEVPSRAERFLGGDLRTRLLRFLTSPDMPLIAKTEMIATRFDLPPETAQEMLEDVADDPPAGIRLTPVREGAWRIERTRT